MHDGTIDAGLSAVLGFRTVEASPDRVVLEWDVSTQHRQPYGIVQGGVHCAAAETAASIGAALWLGDRGRAVSISNRTDFIRSVRDGLLQAIATPVDRTESGQLWLVEVRDDDDRLIANGEVRLQHLDH